LSDLGAGKVGEFDHEVSEMMRFGMDFCQSRQLRLEEDLEVKDEKASNETYGSCSQVNLTWLQPLILED
jgi:hypothetical protein